MDSWGLVSCLPASGLNKYKLDWEAKETFQEAGVLNHCSLILREQEHSYVLSSAVIIN